MADRKMTLRERARAWWRANGRSFDEALPPGEQGYLAGWHARGRADRVTKAVVDAAIAHVRDRSGGSECYLINAVANLERAKRRK